MLDDPATVCPDKSLQPVPSTLLGIPLEIPPTVTTLVVVKAPFETFTTSVEVVVGEVAVETVPKLSTLKRRNPGSRVSEVKEVNVIVCVFCDGLVL
jgi:hypothetical protein